MTYSPDKRSQKAVNLVETWFSLICDHEATVLLPEMTPRTAITTFLWSNVSAFSIFDAFNFEVLAAHHVQIDFEDLIT
jgi:hypothetical protein